MSEDPHKVIVNKTRRRTSHKNNKKTILTRNETFTTVYLRTTFNITVEQDISIKNKMI